VWRRRSPRSGAQVVAHIDEAAPRDEHARTSAARAGGSGTARRSPTSRSRRLRSPRARARPRGASTSNNSEPLASKATRWWPARRSEHRAVLEERRAHDAHFCSPQPSPCSRHRRSARPTRAGEPLLRRENRGRDGGRTASASATRRAATGGQHRGIVCPSRHTPAAGHEHRDMRTRVRALSLRPSLRRQGPSLFLYCPLALSDNYTRRPQPPVIHPQLTSLLWCRSLFLAASLTPSGSLALSRKEEADGIGIYLAGQSSDTQPLPTSVGLMEL